MRSTVRLNGFEWPLDPHQIALCSALFFFSVAFFVLFAPLHYGAPCIMLTTVFALLALSAAVNGWLSMHIDPIDDGVLACRAAIAAGKSPPIPSASGAVHFCSICEAYVQPR